ncbi:hypothetical protein SAMN05444398_11857 [Roseovarius pacificus]|uniref:Uncharacterized protein n=1 Tax=Roseovarius pacificus TaxID=337701 RepID=A0A1M7J6W8_9RHOB|nr:hypothetical protein [Roseovarius pacificus]SHM48890.1 hypothetical protein SAMN05444398_11857 [Roseovarius pacificus]
MQSGVHDPVDLERIDPAQNMARFYRVVSRMLWKFPGGALRAYEESVF